MAEKKVKVEKKIVATAGVYDILRRPIISEKAAKLSERNAVDFEVAMDATKYDIIRSVQAIYGVKPTKVNIVVTKGKIKSAPNRKSTGTQRAVKKAYVSIPADAKLDMGTEVK